MPRNLESNLQIACVNRYVLSFSGGRTSAYMVTELLKLKEYEDAVIIFCNTGKEKEETLLFVDNCDQLWGGRIIWLEYNPDPNVWYNIVSYKTASRKGEPFAALIKKRNYTPNRVARFCTQDLKIRPIKKFCQRGLGWDHWTNLVGIRYDEPRRWNKSKSVERNEVFDVEHPLVKMQVTKQMVLAFWKQMPFDLQLKDYEGNCDLCFLKGIKKKQMILRENPEAAEWWISMEVAVGGKFHADYSFSQLLEYIKKQPQLFGLDDSIDCFCNID